MKAYYLNRSDRKDRDLLYKGAMACAGFAPHELIREDAIKIEDYPSREAVCEAAEREFPEYFGYHKCSSARYPGVGHLVCSWGTMRAWRRIADGGVWQSLPATIIMFGTSLIWSSWSVVSVRSTSFSWRITHATICFCVMSMIWRYLIISIDIGYRI